MRNFLEKYAIHPALFVIYFVFFLYSRNSEGLSLSVIFEPILFGVLFILIEFLFVWIFIRNKLKAAIAVTLLNIPLLNYGIIYDTLEKLYVKGFWPLSNIHRYLLIISGVYCVIVIFYCVKKLKAEAKLNFRLNAFFLILLMVSIISHVTNLNSKKELTVQANITPGELVERKDLPNIYYFIMDGYANQHILKKYYGFDNTNFISTLDKNGFYVADSSISNYYNTILSLNGTLNMEFNTDLEATQVNLNENHLFKYMKKRGYKIYTISSGYAVTGSFKDVDSIIQINVPTEFERILLKYTVFKLDDLFGFLHYQRLKCQVEKMDALSAIGGKGKFFMTHMVTPHPPYVFNEKGEHIFGGKNNNKGWEPKENYIAQTRYFNNVLLKFVNTVVQNDKNAIIIIQSDHGPWIKSKNGDEIFEARSMILNAIRMPEANDSLLYRSISSINTFRLLRKVYFKEKIELLKDSMAGKPYVYNAVLFKNLRESELR